jgi:hypothetical protein
MRLFIVKAAKKAKAIQTRQKSNSAAAKAVTRAGPGNRAGATKGGLDEEVHDRRIDCSVHRCGSVFGSQRAQEQRRVFRVCGVQSESHPGPRRAVHARGARTERGGGAFEGGALHYAGRFPRARGHNGRDYLVRWIGRGPGCYPGFLILWQQDCRSHWGGRDCSVPLLLPLLLLVPRYWISL